MGVFRVVTGLRPSAGPSRRAADWRLALLDVALVVASWAAALELRYDGAVPAHAWAGWSLVVPAAVAATVVAHAYVGLYAGVGRHASLYEARRIVVTQLGVVTMLLPFVVIAGRPVPLSVPVIAGGLVVAATGAARFRSRLVAHRCRAGADAIVVVGAGSAGTALVRDVTEGRHQVRVVAFLDDDPRLLGRRIQGVPVLGTVDDLPHIAHRAQAAYAVLAVPSATPELGRRVAALAELSGIVLRVVPPLRDLVNGQVQMRDVRDIEPVDLLSRGQVEAELGEVADLLRGRRVLVTGAGGSIGSEIARQVAALADHLVLLDHDETHLFDCAAKLAEVSAGTVVQRLVDIREPDAVRQVFEEQRPDIVFHAAAHKHVPLLEAHPVEAVQTNVIGTQTVVEAARRVGVRRFVFVSTDKAVRPSCVMGATKQVGESVVLSRSGGMTACAVRFGNVLGSRGSVVPTFVQQIREGGPVTITDPRMTRYFMSIPEAVRLVLHAGALARGGEVFMLDMGEPVRILDLAHRMIRLSGRRPGLDVEIRVTGVRPGEKLQEQLHTHEEEPEPTSHPSIMRLSPRPLAGTALDETLEQLARAALVRDDATARDLLHRATRSAPIPPRPRTPVSTGEVAGAWT